MNEIFFLILYFFSYKEFVFLYMHLSFFLKETVSILKSLKSIVSEEEGFFWMDEYADRQLDRIAQDDSLRMWFLFSSPFSSFFFLSSRFFLLPLSSIFCGDENDFICNHPPTVQIVNILHLSLTVPLLDTEPQSFDARRRLTFFVNSVFMSIPRAPRLEEMSSWTVLTPFYAEDVMYSQKDLNSAGQNNVSLIFYLQTIFRKVNIY